MSSIKQVIPIIAAASVGGLIVLALNGRQTSSAAPASQIEPQVTNDARDRELAELRRRLAKLETRERTERPEQSGQGAEDPATADEPARDPKLVAREQAVARWMDDHYTPAVQARVFGRYFADVDQQRLRETKDVEWANGVQRGLEKMLKEGELGPAELERLDCGGTLCRVQLNVARPENRGDLVRSMQRILHFDEASAHMPVGEHKLEAVLAREGSTLPQFDQLKYVGEEMNDDE